MKIKEISKPKDTESKCGEGDCGGDGKHVSKKTKKTS